MMWAAVDWGVITIIAVPPTLDTSDQSHLQPPPAGQVMINIICHPECGGRAGSGYCDRYNH